MKIIIIKLGCIFVLFLLIVYFMPSNNKVIEEDKSIYVTLTMDEESIQIELETYLLGVIASEMPYSFEMEALKAQALAARTFVYERGLVVDNTMQTQVYKSETQLKEIFDEEYETMLSIVETAVNETKGEILTYEGEVISALFYSSNNGYSNNAQDYYTTAYPYLISVDSHWDLTFEQTTSTISLSIEEVKQKLGVEDLTISNIVLYENGYVSTIQIGNTTYTGREVREYLGLRSSCFSIAIFDEVYIETIGYGHGVGMSQYGAQGMALEGYTYDEIVKHYYEGVEIKQLYE